MSQGRVADVLLVQPTQEEQNPESMNNDMSKQTVPDTTNRLLEAAQSSACTTRS